MKLINLTPHLLTLVGSVRLDVPTSGTIARLAVTREARPDVVLDDGTVLAVARPTLGAVTGLPDALWTLTVQSPDAPGVDEPLDVVAPYEGVARSLAPAGWAVVDARVSTRTVYIVSALVAEAVKRPDVMSPGELIRDAAGVIIGARGLCAYV